MRLAVYQVYDMSTANCVSVYQPAGCWVLLSPCIYGNEELQGDLSAVYTPHLALMAIPRKRVHDTDSIDVNVEGYRY